MWNKIEWIRWVHTPLNWCQIYCWAGWGFANLVETWTDLILGRRNRDHFYPLVTFTSVSKTIYKQQIFVVSYKYSKTNNSITGSRSTAASSIWQQDHFYRYVWQILFCMLGKYYFVYLANIILYVWQILFCMFGKYYFSFFVHLSNINQYHWAYLVNSMFYTWQEEFKHLKVRFKGICL